MDSLALKKSETISKAAIKAQINIKYLGEKI